MTDSHKSGHDLSQKCWRRYQFHVWREKRERRKEGRRKIGRKGGKIGWRWRRTAKTSANQSSRRLDEAKHQFFLSFVLYLFFLPSFLPNSFFSSTLLFLVLSFFCLLSSYSVLPSLFFLPVFLMFCLFVSISSFLLSFFFFSLLFLPLFLSYILS